MAQFGIPATQMSAPDTGAASYIRKPVQDTSGVELFSTVLDQAGEAYKGYQLASLEQEQEAVIDQYISSKQNPDIMQQTEADIGALDSAAEGLWNKIATQADYQPDVRDLSGVEKTLAEKLARYKAAKDQGVMSPDEFTNRILATTREAVARNPGLYAELKQHSSRVLEMSGITDIVRADMETAKSVEKQQKDMQDYFLAQGTKYNVPVPFNSAGSVDWTSFVPQIQKIQHQEQQVAIAENVGKLNTETDKANGRSFMRSNGLAMMNGKLGQILNQGISLIGQGGDFQGGITQVRLMLNAAKQQYAEQLAPIANEPGVKAAIDYLDKQSQIIEDLLAKAGSKEDAVRVSENAMKLLRNSQYEAVSKNMNPEALKQITSLMSTAGAARIIDQNPEAMGEIMQTLGNVFSGAANGLGTNYSAKLGNDNVVSLGVKHLATEAIKDPTVLTTLEQTLGTISQDVQNPNKFPNPEDKFKFYEKLVHDLTDPAVKAGISKIGSGAYSQTAGMIDDYMTMTTPAMMTSINKWEQQGVPITMDVLPDGRVVFKSENRQVVQDLNSRYASRINDSLSAMSNLMGLDTKSVAATHFYPNYLPAWADDPDIQPLEIRTKDEADLAFQQKKITRQEYDAILGEMGK